MTVLERHRISPIPLLAVFASVAGGIVDALETFSGQLVAALRVFHVDVAAAFASFALATNHIRVTPVADVAAVAVKLMRMKLAFVTKIFCNRIHKDKQRFGI